MRIIHTVLATLLLALLTTSAMAQTTITPLNQANRVPRQADNPLVSGQVTAPANIGEVHIKAVLPSAQATDPNLYIVWGIQRFHADTQTWEDDTISDYTGGSLDKNGNPVLVPTLDTDLTGYDGQLLRGWVVFYWLDGRTTRINIGIQITYFTNQ